MSARPANARAVMADRREPSASDDFFPTPPWAVRALCEQRLIADYRLQGETLVHPDATAVAEHP